MTDTPDFAERRRALDPAYSFIVQAPAGSGKTGLLIQRYLKLLACVNEPEEIVAITFTRKAAGEMRERVLGAFAQAGTSSTLRLWLKPSMKSSLASWLKQLLGAISRPAGGWPKIRRGYAYRHLIHDAPR